MKATAKKLTEGKEGDNEAKGGAVERICECAGTETRQTSYDKGNDSGSRGQKSILSCAPTGRPRGALSALSGDHF